MGRYFDRCGFVERISVVWVLVVFSVLWMCLMCRVIWDVWVFMGVGCVFLWEMGGSGLVDCSELFVGIMGFM